jgi:hypothetical protein
VRRFVVAALAARSLIVGRGDGPAFSVKPFERAVDGADQEPGGNLRIGELATNP